MTTTIMCAVTGASSTVISQADHNLTHEIKGEGENRSRAEVIMAASTPQSGSLNYEIMLFADAANFPANVTSSVSVKIVQNLVTSSDQKTASMHGTITVQNADLENSGVKPTLNLTIAGQSISCGTDNIAQPIPVSVNESVSLSQPIALEVDVSLTCESIANEGHSDGKVAFLIVLQLFDPMARQTIPFIDEQYFATKAIAASAVASTGR